VMGKIGEQLVVVLIDTGSTHSFVDHNLAMRIRLPAEKISQVNVMLASGDYVHCMGCCVAVSFSLQ
jgi:predicted aspartyl protease